VTLWPLKFRGYGDGGSHVFKVVIVHAFVRRLNVCFRVGVAMAPKVYVHKIDRPVTSSDNWNIDRRVVSLSIGRRKAYQLIVQLLLTT
jgi:hypothetical protein